MLVIICDPKLKLSIPTGVYRIQMGNIDQKSMTQKKLYPILKRKLTKKSSIRNPDLDELQIFEVVMQNESFKI